jgi:lipopolysaccharide transport system permease protein
MSSQVDRLDDLPVVVYTPASQVRTPGRLLRAMWRDLRASRELAWRFFIRDISAKYRQSLLGFFWALGPPIITAWIFTVLRSNGVVDFGETHIPYPVFVVVGTVLWQLFTESLTTPLRTITAERTLLAKLNFPREALVISSVYMVLVHMLVKLVVLAGVFVVFKIQPTWGLLLAPLAMFMLVLLGIGLGLLLTPLGMLYSDIAASLPIGIQLFFFLTPVVYPPPESFPLSLVAVANPVSHLLVGTRELLVLGTMSNGIGFLCVSGTALAILFVAWVLYRVALPIVIERLSA